jgi:hypothetical protein
MLAAAMGAHGTTVHPRLPAGDDASSTISTHGDGSSEDDDNHGLSKELQRLGYTN